MRAMFKAATSLPRKTCFAPGDLARQSHSSRLASQGPDRVLALSPRYTPQQILTFQENKTITKYPKSRSLRRGSGMGVMCCSLPRFLKVRAAGFGGNGGVWYDAIMTNAPHTRRWLQFRLRTLLLLVVLIAVVCSVLAPFRPDVSFSYLGRDTHSNSVGNEESHLRVAITNDGFFPIWYPAKAGRSAGFVYQSSPPKLDLSMLDDVPYDMGYDEWLELRPGKTTELQVDDSTAFMKEILTEQSAGNDAQLKLLEEPLWFSVTLPVRDWRGRQAICWHEPFRIE